MPAYALAIFDFDGTLADSFPWFCSVLDQTADRFGLRRVDPGDIPRLREMSSRDALSYLGVPAWKLPQITIFMRSLMSDGIAGIPMFPGASEALAALDAAGVRLALVSSNAEANVRAVLGEAEGRIGFYACGSSLWGKAQKFRRALKALNVPAHSAIVIGDEIRDVEAAREAGLAVGSITFGYNARDALTALNPDYVFDSYDALLQALA
jgi:phosphoglycolate phosphatase